RHVLDIVAEPVGGDVGERLLNAGRPIQLVGEWDRHSGLRDSEADDATRPAEIDSARPGLTVLEHSVLLAEPEVSEIDKGVPKPERVRARTHGLRSTVLEVSVDERVDGPVVEGGRRPRIQTDAANPGTHVKVVTGGLRNGDGAGDELIPGGDLVR